MSLIEVCCKGESILKSMKKKIFPILTVLLIPVNCILGIMLYLFEIVNFYDGIGEIIYSTACIIGALGAPIGILGVIAGFILRRKGRKKAGMIVPLVGLIIQVTILAGFLILDGIETIGRASSDNQWYEETYGEDWDAPSKIDGIPRQYEKILNQIYVSVRDEWKGDQLYDPMIFSSLQSLYYEGDGLKNIGFAVTDLNGDGGEELIIAPINDVEGYENIVLQVYTEKRNPHQLYGSNDDMLHYFHLAEDGTYYVECDRTWDDGSKETYVYKITRGLPEYEGRYDIEVDVKVEAKDRVKLKMIPFSEYK